MICPTRKRVSYLLLFQQESIKLSEYTIQPPLIVQFFRACGFRDIPGEEPDCFRAQLSKLEVHFRYERLEIAGWSGCEKSVGDGATLSFAIARKASRNCSGVVWSSVISTCDGVRDTVTVFSRGAHSPRD